MEKLINFIDTIAWISCILSFLLICLQVWGMVTYSKLEEQLDRLRNVKATFPIKVPGIIFVLSLSWLVS